MISCSAPSIFDAGIAFTAVVAFHVGIEADPGFGMVGRWGWRSWGRRWRAEGTGLASCHAFRDRGTAQFGEELGGVVPVAFRVDEVPSLSKTMAR